MDRITDAFVWPVREPNAVPKLLIIGLIFLIPIVGWINALGWMLTGIDQLRAGDERLPPANFSYLGRGARLFVVNVVYILAIAVLAAIFYFPAVTIFNSQSSRPINGWLFSLGLLLSLLAFSVATLGSLAVTFATPAIVLATDHGGIAGGLRVAQVVHRIRESPMNTLIAGLMLVAASFVGQLGVILCGVGIIFTSAYAFAMQAWIVRSYELGAAAPARVKEG